MFEKVSRREFLAATSAGIAAVSGATANSAESVSSHAESPRLISAKAPFDTFRDYINALDEHGLPFSFEF